MKIREVAPAKVVCQDERYREWASKLLSGVNIPIVLLNDSDIHGMFLVAEKAAWLGEYAPPMQGHYDFVYSYTGGM